jgi:diguanylate cyclase (GGDEF)-like protein/PAS domain S-box-containing protein
VSKDLSAEQEALQKFEQLFQGNPVLTAVSSLQEGRFIEVNEAFLSTLGYAREEVLGHTADELDLFVEPEQQRAVAERMQAQGRASDCELKVRRKDGSILDGRFSGEIIESQGQQYLLTVMVDETDRKRADEALRASEEQLSSAVAGSGVGLWDWRPQTGEETFSERWAEIIGYTLAELSPTSVETWRRLRHPEDLQRADLLLEEHFSGQSGIYACEGRMRHKDGHWVWVLDQGKVSERDADGRPLRMIGTALDISERKQAEEALAGLNDELTAEAAALAEANAMITRIAATDVLTGLANRRHFHESLERAVSLARRHSTPLALVSLDLDGLKRVNDTSGHEAGDEVLTSFAALLADLCRAEDLPARLGGDEFSLLLPGVELDGARGLAERVLAAVRSSAALAQRRVTVSAGVAQWAPGELPDELLRRADRALYGAKREGGDAVAGGA